MEIKLTNEECLTYFYNALCNAVGTGYILGHGIELVENAEDYAIAKIVLQENNRSVCYEDVLIEILKEGKQLTMQDVEGSGEYTRSITIQDVYSRVPKTPLPNLVRIIRENDDVEDADVLLQTVFFEQIVFG